MNVPENGRNLQQVIFYPFDGENCSADGCWATFEDGRLIGLWLSPD